MFSNRVPMEREASSPETMVYSFIYMSESPIRSPPTKNGENIWSPSTEPHVDGRPTYNGVWLGSPRDRLQHCNLYPSAMQPSARYFSPWLG